MNRRVEARKPTRRQIQAVKFCESVLDVKFEGDMGCVSDVSSFIGTYLLTAQVMMEDAEQSYYSNFDARL